MGLFSDIKTTAARVQSDYHKPGLYWMKLTQLKQDANRNKIPYCAISAQVIRVIDNADDTGHREGDDVGQVIRAGDYFLKEIKTFLAAVVGVKPNDAEGMEAIDEEFTEEAFSPDSPLKGVVMEVRSFLKPTKEVGKLFVNTQYKRRIDEEELKETLTDAQKKRFFPEFLAEG